ncbi:Threonine/homoserine efflux transporter RhtA [Marinomonas polaris DSM 16579]|uniref:Threonine/homoserine efflux transporter RhtA n=1 Tax=Marinomonas polaris DSM 16579 TaxID=1122206 RepID=A0A1M5LVR6_9GAMM|nr:DMT family transporter [Marinomonas polaris]SHG69147.1 Threonine/homoserine efflux transporter RhtA [Marinomonas polaris DSM 16579]
MEKSKKNELDKVGLSAAWFAALGWASTGIFVRHFPNWPPLNIVAGRFLVAFVAISLILLFNHRRANITNAIKHPLTWILSALMVAYYLCATIAFQLAPVGEVSLGISMSPVFVLLFHLLTGRNTPLIEKIGSAVSLFGVILVFLPSFATQSDFQYHVVGCLLALAGAAIMATYVLAYQYRSPKHHPPSSISVSLLTFTLGLFIMISYLVVNQQILIFEELRQTQPLLLMLGLGLMATIVPTLSYSIASQRLSSMLTTSIRLATPTIAALLAIVFLHEMPAVWFWFGSSFVIGGLLLMTWQKKTP